AVLTRRTRRDGRAPALVRRSSAAAGLRPRTRSAADRAAAAIRDGAAVLTRRAHGEGHAAREDAGVVRGARGRPRDRSRPSADGDLAERLRTIGVDGLDDHVAVRAGAGREGTR